MWVYSASSGSLLWSNEQANTLFAMDLAGSQITAAASSCTHCREVIDLQHRVEEMGCSVEIEFSWTAEHISDMHSFPGWPQVSVSDAMCSGSSKFKLCYHPILAPAELFPGDAGKGQTCCLVQLQEGTVPCNETDMQRVVAMYNSCPIFRFLFDQNGKLLKANERAVQHCRELLESSELTIWSLFQLGLYKSEEHRLHEYNLAMDTVFKKRQTFRCQQERVSRKNSGQRKWVELEMWPLTDPITGLPAVQISQMSMTNTKKAEVALLSEKDELKLSKEALEAKLKEQEEKDSLSRRALHMKSPMEKIVDLFDSLMAGGEVPDMETLMSYRFMVATASNLRQPSNLVGELLDDETLETDVGLSILQQLGYRLSNTRQTPSSVQAHDTDFEDGLPLRPSSFTQSSRDFSGALHSLMDIEDISYEDKIKAVAIRNTRRTESEKDSETGSLHLSSNLGIGHRGIDNAAFSELSGPHMVPVLERVLARAQEWDFNVFELEEVSQGNPLSTLAFFLLKQSGLTRAFELDESRLSLWLRAVENSYQENCYHNRIHAADVTQSMFQMLTRGGLHQGLRKVQMLAAILAAVVHDTDHPGQSNDFLIAVADPLAIKYNDNSPLENHHLCASFNLLHRNEYNFLHNMERDTYRTLRTLMIDLVLATDMKRHFDILSQFQVSLSIRKDSSSSPTSSGDVSSGARNLWVRIPDNEMDDAQHTLKLQVALKVADLGHLAAPQGVHREWVERLQEEFFCQGDREAALNLPVSPLMDRHKPGISCAQVGFLEVVAMPLFKSLVTAYSPCMPLLEALERNYMMWARPETVSERPRNNMRKRQNTI